MVKNCVRNRSRPDEIDTATEICTYLKSEFYFRFRWPPSTKSVLISYISFGVFVTIRGWKYVHHNRKNAKIRLCTSLKTGKLLPVCPRNNSVRKNHISERRPLPLCQIRCISVHGGLLGTWVKYNQNYFYLCLFFINSPTGQTHRRIFTHDGSNDACKDVPFTWLHI